MTLDMQRRHQPDGYTVAYAVEDAVRGMRHEFSDLDYIGSNAVGGFGLEGEDLDEFLRLAIRAMLRAGAIPLTWNGETEWTAMLPTTRYGTTEDEIVERTLREWHEAGGPARKVWLDPPVAQFCLPEKVQWGRTVDRRPIP